MADSRLDIVLKQIDKKYGKGTVIRGSQYPDLPRFSSGIFSLDVEIGGGIPRGRILIMTGNESTGKTTVAKKVLATAQNTCAVCNTHFQADLETGEWQCPKCKDDGRPFKGFYCDIEGTFDPRWFEALGGHPEDLYLFQPEFAEQAVDVIEAVIRTGEVDIVVIDSIAMMSPAVEIEKSAEDQLMGTHAKLVNRMIRAIQAGFNSLGTANTQKPTVLLINQLREKVGVMFGCIHGETKITLVDGRSYTMKELVENEVEGSVLSYNEETETFEPRKIVAWHYNGDVEKAEDYISFKAKGVDTKNGVVGFTVTRDHEVYTETGTKKAKDIGLGDKVLTQALYNFANGTARQFLLGMLCGDSHISVPRGYNTGYLILQDTADPDYVTWKIDKLAPFLSFTSSKTSRGTLKYRSNSSYELKELKETFGERDPAVMLDEFSPLSLAVWYMDDGAFDTHDGHYRASISVKRFKNQPEKLERIKQRLADNGLQVRFDKEGSIIFDKANTHKLFQLIAPYVPPCMNRKLGDEYRNEYSDFTLVSEPKRVPVLTDIQEIRPASRRQMRTRGRYDITVEGNHNYLVGSATNGVLVHNSPETMPGGRGQSFASSITLKFFARPSERLYESIGEKKPVGQQVRFNVEKNKTYPPHKQGIFTLYTDTSEEYGVRKGKIDNTLSILRYGVRYDIVTKAGSWLSYVRDNGEEVKVQGEDRFVIEMERDRTLEAEIAKKVMDEVLGDRQ